MRPLTAARRLHRALDDLEQTLHDTSGLPDPTLAAMLAILDRSGAQHPPGAAQRLSAIVGDLRAILGQRLPFKEPVAYPGVGVLERSMTGRRYSWDDGRRLAHIIAARCADESAVNRETGEIVPPGVLAGAVADALIACGGLDNKGASWRTTELEARGIDPKDHRSVANEGRLGTRWKD